MGDSTDGGLSTPSRLQAKCASKAVAFVIKHSQKGIVSLCTNIATIMEERDRLLEENERLKRSLEATGTGVLAKTRKRVAATVCPASTQTDDAELIGVAKKGDSAQEGRNTTDLSADFYRSWSMVLRCLQTNTAINAVHVLRELSGVASSWVPLESCLCERCQRFPGPKARPKALALGALEKGRRAVVRDRLLGKVRYVGHLDSSTACAVWVGLDLEEPLGFTDGSLGSKTYFSCKPRCGIFASISSVTYVSK
ncbi:uncharacterized protein ISCGN_032441 [Ixodes scapularis]